MGPKATAKGNSSFNLDDWKPTDEELQAARELIRKSDDKAKRSKTACMVAFLSKHDEATAAKVSGLRGPERQEYTAKYLAYMLRKKTGTLHATQAHTSSTISNHDFYFWSKFELYKNVGPKKADHWIQSGKMERHADRLTGVIDDDDLCEWKVPVAWLRETERSDDRLALQGDQQASKADVENFHSMQIHKQAPATEADQDQAAEEQPQAEKPQDEGKKASDDEPLQTRVKKEKTQDQSQADPDHEMKQKVIQFLAAPADTLAQLQAYELEASQIIPAAKSNPLFANFVASMQKHMDQLKRMNRGVMAMVSGAKDLDECKLPTLVRMLELLKDRHCTLLDFAILNGIWSPSQKRKGGKKAR